MKSRIIFLHPSAPTKPATGSPCNGCGVCCAAETCPAGRVLFLKVKGPCPALLWGDERYHCGLLVAPGKHLRWLPRFMNRFAQRIFTRSIAAGAGCDSDAELSEDPS